MIRQAPIRAVSLASIMKSPEFKLGFEGRRRGEAFDWRIDSWDYERGRQFAGILPLDISLLIGRSLNPKAVAVASAAFDRGWLI